MHLINSMGGIVRISQQAHRSIPIGVIRFHLAQKFGRFFMFSKKFSRERFSDEITREMRKLLFVSVL